MTHGGSIIILFVIACFGGAEDVIRKTKQGTLRGRKLVVRDTFIEEYQGIPYAKSPVGELRFRAPLPHSSWTGTFDATKPLAACPQLQFDLSRGEYHDYSEDCLRLNIWTPVAEKGKLLPVLAWIHGGAFTIGSANSYKSNGTYFSTRTGCVVVAMNYRLGALGFLNGQSPEAPGNMGLLDQNLALKWVQENIESFGGNPSLVTLMGGSGGSHSVNIHIVSSMSKGLFARAIMMSGSACSKMADSPHESMRKGNQVAKAVGCSRDGQELLSHTAEVVGCLRLKSVEELLRASVGVGGFSILTFLPTYNDRLLPKDPSVSMERGFFNYADVLAGGTSDEAGYDLLLTKSKLLEEISKDIDQFLFDSWLKALVPPKPESMGREMLMHYINQVQPSDRESLRRMYLDYRSDRYYVCHMQYFAEKYSGRGNAVYKYIFGHKYAQSPVPEWMGVTHTQDFLYHFAAPLSPDSNYTEEDVAFSDQFAQIVASFLKFG